MKCERTVLRTRELADLITMTVVQAYRTETPTSSRFSLQCETSDLKASISNLERHQYRR
jgi:hypothetical protein